MSAVAVIKAKDLAEMLGCSVFTIEERARRRELPGLKFGDGGWVFPLDATNRVLNDMAMNYVNSEAEPVVSLAAFRVPSNPRQPPQLPAV